MPIMSIIPIMFNNKVINPEMPHMKLIIYNRELMMVSLVISKVNRTSKISKTSCNSLEIKMIILMIKKPQLIKLKWVINDLYFFVICFATGDKCGCDQMYVSICEYWDMFILGYLQDMWDMWYTKHLSFLLKMNESLNNESHLCYTIFAIII